MVRWSRVEGDAGELFNEAVRRAAADPCGLSSQMRALRFAAAHLLEQGQTDAALAAADAGVALSQQAGLIWSSYGLDLRLLRGWTLAAQGQWDDVLRESLDAAYAPTSPGRVLATQALAVLVSRGDPAADGLLERLRGTGDSYAEVQLDLCEIELLTQRGDGARAEAIAVRRLPEIRHQGETESLLLAARAAIATAELATAARSAGDPSAASIADRTATYAAIARQTSNLRAGHPPAIELWAAWADAEAARAAGQNSAAAWAGVVALAEAAGRVEDIAAASLRCAEAALDAGSRDVETVEALRKALSIATTLKALPLKARAEDLVRRARLEVEVGLDTGPAVEAVRGAAALTAREGEVLALLADGLSNRRIGRELFISEKTASVHVSNIIGKLSAASRTEAVAIARRQGLLSGGDS
jgi:DNA-binding NarL/FixJ family response regulator